MKPVSYMVTQKHTFVPNTTTVVELPTMGYTTQLSCQLKFNLTALGAPALTEDSWGRIIKSVRINASGYRTLFDCTDGRQWQYSGHFDYKGQLRRPVIDPLGPFDYYIDFPIHLGRFPNNVYDLTGVIPAVEMDNLNMEITWGDVSDLTTVPGDVVINSGEMTITNYGINLDTPAEKAQIWPGGIPQPIIEARIIPIGAVYSNLGLTDDIPVGNTLIDALLIVLDNTGVRSDARVSKTGFYYPKRMETPWALDWQSFISMSQLRADLQTIVPGVALFKAQDVSHDPVGMDLYSYASGDVQLGFTTLVNNGNIHAFYRMAR